MRNDDDEPPRRFGERSEKPLSEHSQLAGGLNEFAKRLEAFAPRSTFRDRDALMFAAGQASQLTIGRPHGAAAARTRFWQGATAAMTVLASCLGIVVSLQLGAEPRVLIVERERPLETSPVVPRGSDSGVTGTEQSLMPGVKSLENLISTAENRQFADAWEARRKLIDQVGSSDRIALLTEPVTSVAGDIRAVDPPLTPLSVMGSRSSETIHRLLENPL